MDCFYKILDISSAMFYNLTKIFLACGDRKMKRLITLFLVMIVFSLCGLAAQAADEVPPEEGTTAPAVEQPTEAPDEPGEVPEEPAEPELPSIFTISENASFSIMVDGTMIDIYEKTVYIDTNNDGEYNTAESRHILRVAVNLEDAPDQIESLDFDSDGAITTADARRSLRYNLHLLSLCCAEDGTIYTGFFESNDGKTRYFDEIGGLAIGYMAIDGVYYYFEPDGAMFSGLTQLRGVPARFDENGEGIQGFYEEGSARYYFKNGLALTGWQTIDEKKYYFYSDGVMAAGDAAIDGKTYYFSEDGSIRDGMLTIDGSTYYYQDGLPYVGWLFDGLNAYYFDKNGKRLENTTSGNYQFNQNGVATATTLTTDTLPVYLRGILKRIGTSPSEIYNYVRYNFRYRYYAKSTPEAMAVRILRNGRGACYDYAYLTKFLLEAAGYEARVVVGGSFNYANGNEHDWVLYKANGVWRYMDTQRGAFAKTASQMRALGYRWDASGLPATL